MPTETPTQASQGPEEADNLLEQSTLTSQDATTAHHAFTPSQIALQRSLKAQAQELYQHAWQNPTGLFAGELRDSCFLTAIDTRLKFNLIPLRLTGSDFDLLDCLYGDNSPSADRERQYAVHNLVERIRAVPVLPTDLQGGWERFQRNYMLCSFLHNLKIHSANLTNLNAVPYLGSGATPEYLFNQKALLESDFIMLSFTEWLQEQDDLRAYEQDALKTISRMRYQVNFYQELYLSEKSQKRLAKFSKVKLTDDFEQYPQAIRDKFASFQGKKQHRYKTEFADLLYQYQQGDLSDLGFYHKIKEYIQSHKPRNWLEQLFFIFLPWNWGPGKRAEQYLQLPQLKKFAKDFSEAYVNHKHTLICEFHHGRDRVDYLAKKCAQLTKRIDIVTHVMDAQIKLSKREKCSLKALRAMKQRQNSLTEEIAKFRTQGISPGRFSDLAKELIESEKDVLLAGAHYGKSI